MKTKNIIKFLLCWLTVVSLQAQTCAGNTFSSPGQPATCTYTYTGSGWDTSPPSTIASGTSVCILADVTFPFNTVKGTLYVAAGVTYTGQINSFANGATLVVDGTADLTGTAPSVGGTNMYISDTGTLNIPGNFVPGGTSNTHNAGIVNISGNFTASGQANYINYPEATFIVQGDANIANDYENCGLLEVYQDITTGGTSSLNNYCSTYVHQDLLMNGAYTNDGLMFLDGTLVFNGTFYNEDILVINNIDIDNDDLVGNDVNSLLIVRNNAELSSGGSITGHYFYDIDDGGGFDAVCGSCVEDLDIVFSIDMPATTTEVLENCGADVVINPFIEESKLDFDGVDDYLSTDSFIDGLNEVTIMAWVKRDAPNATHWTIAGEDTGCQLWLKNGYTPGFTIKGSGISAKQVISPGFIAENEWHHITGSYTSTTGLMKLYIDGVLVNSATVSATGASIENTASSNGNFEVGRRSTSAGSEYLKGNIDEVRVFNTTLTDSQIQRMVYQEIEDNGGVIKGKIINKNITDIATDATIPWSSLLAYYPLSDVVSFTRTTDFSLYDRITKLHNIDTFQDETAPLPYVSSSNGNWTSESTWLHGDVWDIEDVANNKDWSIVHVKDDISASHAVKNIGLFIDASKTLVVNGDNQVENSWYLELNGTLDLQDDSQLIQTTTSDLVTSATGKILRRQEGTASPYWYNYWSSPVGATGVTSLSNNNAATNNPNNSDFSLDMLKDDFGFNIPFTSGYTASGNVSTYWLYTFISGITYWDWAFLPITTDLNPGVGYTQKGTGTAAPKQQYIFEGKPNNGTILIDVEDVGGAGSVPNDSKTEYLLGNPYASALDIHKFIDDNAGVIDGYLQLWQQWGGTSHNVGQYQGGYAQVNKTGSIRAYQFVSFYGANNGSQDGTIVPTRYLPVGQGFITEIVADGQIEFNNSQRVFVKESDADGTYNNGSTFSRSTKGKSTKGKASKTATTETPMQKIRLEFNSTSGPATRHELLLGFSDQTTDAFDFGYDAKNTETKNDDLNLDLDGQNMNIQAYAPITEDKVVPLNFKSSGDHAFEIRISELENIEADQEIYLRDNLTGTYFDLTEDMAYGFSSTQGIFNERFEIVFQSEQQSLSTEEALASDNFIFFKNTTNTLYVKKLNSDVSKLSLVNMRGQVVMEMADVSRTTLENGLQFDNVSTGAYVVWLHTDTNEVLTKKIIVK